MHWKTITIDLILFTSTIFAQISGIVIDSNSGKPIENVNITDGEVGAVTNAKGTFFIDVSLDTELEFSHIAYQVTLLSPSHSYIIR